MEHDIKQALISQAQFCQTLSDHPAVNVTIDDSTQIRRMGNEQQKLASQRPRGTRIDDSGTRIQVKGGRNYTSRKLFISREEIFDDVVVRGLRADGLSTKLGVKNHKDGIRKMLIDLFAGDSRLPVVEENFRTHRQKSNSAKTMFATMTHEELQFLKAETFPSRIDVQVRDYLTNAFSDQPHKLQTTVEVLGQLQQVFKALTPHADFLSSHNFQTRGFFLDIVLMTCSFLMQIIQDSDGYIESQNQGSQNKSDAVREVIVPNVIEEKVVKEAQNKAAAEILLSVGSNILDNSENIKATHQVGTSISGLKFNKGNKTRQFMAHDDNASESNQPLPTTVVVVGEDKQSTEDSDEWTTVEMVDSNGNTRYVLMKTTNDDGEQFDTTRILNLLQSQGVQLDDKIEIALNNQNSLVERPDVKESLESDITLEEVLQNPSDGSLIMDVNSPAAAATSDLQHVGQPTSEDVVIESSKETMLQREDSTDMKDHDSASDLLNQLANNLSDAKPIKLIPKRRAVILGDGSSVRKRRKDEES